MLCLLVVSWRATTLRSLAQSENPTAAQTANEPSVALEPVPHLRGTGLLALPSGISQPAAMTSPSEGSIYVQQLDEENEYWLKRIAATPALRDTVWHPDFSSTTAYRKSLENHRQTLRRMLGLLPDREIEISEEENELERDSVRLENVTINIVQGFEARALILVPPGRVSGAVIAIPDAMESREEFLGLAVGESPAPWLKILLSSGLAVAVPSMIERTTDYPFGGHWGVNRRQLLYRLGFIVGHTLVGLEVQETLALRDYLTRRMGIANSRIGMLGVGQGGMTAFYAAGVDGQFGPVAIVDYFQQRQDCWQEPVDRMIYGQLNEFGDAEVAGLIAPEPLAIITSDDSGIIHASVEAEEKRARRFYDGLRQPRSLSLQDQPSAEIAVRSAAETLSRGLGQQEGEQGQVGISKRFSEEEIASTKNAQFEGLHTYLKQVDRDSDEVRSRYWKLSSVTPSTSASKAAEIRSALGELMGRIPMGTDQLDVRTRLIQISDRFVAYDVLLDTLPGVHAYGQLLVPRHMQGRLPVVICQHGLGGRPADITGVGKVAPVERAYYHDLGSYLANLGYVVFAPYLAVPIQQEVLVNPLVRKAATVGMMRTALELAKLHRIVDFLQTLPFVDGGRIGYYGLSYGGYSAIWMPPLEPRIKLNIISGHFNYWRAKITDEESSWSYLRFQDADFYNWNVLNRLSHAELIAAMAPRPVCIEAGQSDPITTPEWTARAWKEVEEWKNAAGLGGLTEKIVLAHFQGVHEVHGIEAVSFLNRWLRPDLPDGRGYTYDLLSENKKLQAVSGGSSSANGQAAELPLVQHEVNGNPETWIRGRFYVQKDSSELGGIALQVSRVGNPGQLIVRFGSTPGGDDLGQATMEPGDVKPSGAFWYTARVRPIRPDQSKLYYFEVKAASGENPDNNFIVYGPRPIGGTDDPGHFGLSYRILGSSSHSAARH